MNLRFETAWRESRILGALRAGIPTAPSLENSRVIQWLRRAARLFRIPRGVRVMRVLLTLLLWACVFIPRLPLSRLSGFYSLDLKAEDLLLILCGITFLLLKPADRKLVRGPLVSLTESFFLFFLMAAGVSILNGLLIGTLDKPWVSLLYLAKWFEYFLVFVFAARLTRAPEDADYYLKHFFFLGLAAALYGYAEHFYPSAKAVYPNYYRLYERAPFHGDANHLGGLLAVWMAFFSAVYFRVKDWRKMAALACALLFVLFPLIWTFSRKSYFALAMAFILTFFIPGIQRRRWFFLGSLLAGGGLLLPTRLAERLNDLGEVMTAVDPYHSSWAGNLDVWGKCFWNFQHFWALGAGFGARHRLFYESQYVMTLTETGILGFFIFLVLLLVPAILVFRRINQPERRGLFAGAWISAWIALCVHNISCVSLTVSKVAIPWWFLTGCVFGLLVSEEEKV